MNVEYECVLYSVLYVNICACSAPGVYPRADLSRPAEDHLLPSGRTQGVQSELCVRARTSEVSVVTSAAATADSAEQSRCIQPVWLLCTCCVVYCIGGAGGGLARRVAGRAVRTVVARVPHVRAALRRALLRVRAHPLPLPLPLLYPYSCLRAEPSAPSVS